MPIEIVNRWKEYHLSVMELSSQSIPRWIGADCNQNMQWHIFCDASERAYGAVVYLRTQNSDGTIVSRLLTSKSRVAPVTKVTVPRLELLAAHIGAILAEYVINACNLPQIPVYFWSDSTIVIHWLKKDPALQKQFVGNRISSILKITQTVEAKWQHVSGIENPADLLSRGLSSKDLQTATLWWIGPNWLQLPQNQWPQPTVSTLSMAEIEADLKESKPAHIGLINLDASNCFCVEGPNGVQTPLVSLHSTLDSILRISAFIIRFINILKRKCAERKASSKQISSTTGLRGCHEVPIPSPEERDGALFYWIQVAQKCHYPQEVRACEKGIDLPANSQLRYFAPYIDAKGLLHVGGRLENMDASDQSKHQVFVPPESIIGKLLIRNAHFRTLHGGSSINKAFLRQRFWFLRIGMAIKSFTHSCPTCIRYRKQAGEQLMGQLPSVRITMAEPFARVGVDFAGPFKLKKSAGHTIS